MASFLDKTGLTKFWELIQQYLENNFTSKSTTETLTQDFNRFRTDTNLSNYPLNFSTPYPDSNKLEFGGNDHPRLNSFGILGNILINLFFDKLFYLFDVTSNSKSELSIEDVITGINLSSEDRVYLGRVYSNNNRGISRNIDVYIYKTSYPVPKYNISIIPVDDGKVLFSNGLFPLQSINYLEGIVEIQDPLIPGLTIKKLKNDLDNYLPYLENKSTEIKFKVEYANAIRGLLKIYKKSAGNNSLELIGNNSPEDTNFSKHITPGEVVTTYLEPGDRLYMYGTLLSIPGENSLMTNNIVKLLPTLPNIPSQSNVNRYKYIVNITPCTAEGTPINNVDLDQHYLEYGGNLKGMLGYQVDGYMGDNPIFPTVGNDNLSFISFIAYCKYIRKIKVNPTLNQPNIQDIHHIKFNTDVLNLIPIYKRAFKETSVNKGYISLMLYSEGNTSRETVRSFTNFFQTYVECKKLTELDVIIDWYNNSIIPEDIISGTGYNIPGSYNKGNIWSTCKWIIGNVQGCRNLNKITLKYPGDRPYSNKILALLNKVKDLILEKSDRQELKLFHKGLTDNTIDYTIDIQAM